MNLDVVSSVESEGLRRAFTSSTPAPTPTQTSPSVAIPRHQFLKTELQERNDLLAAYDRYLSQCYWERSSQGVVVIAPTSFHAMGLQRLKNSLEAFLGETICSIETRKMDVALARPLPIAALLRQAPLALPQILRIENPRDTERKRRMQAPQLISSQAFSTCIQLTQRWAQSLATGARAQSLWVHGGSGSGKTALLKQLHEWVSLDLHLEATDVMRFFHEWRRSLEAKDHLSFVRKFRKETQVLLLENIDDLQGKTKTQQEVLFTVNAILDQGGSVAVSSTRHPLELKDTLEPALFSRLFSGLLLEMPKPDRAFKESLWRKLVEEYGLGDFSLDIALQERLLAVPVDTARKANTLFINAIGRLSLKRTLLVADILDLEGMHSPVSSSMAPGRNPNETIDQVARLCGVQRAAILGKVRRSNICLARRFVCLALARFNGLTNSVIANLLEKDPSTVSHALKTLEEDLEADRTIAEQWNWICSQLGFSPAP